MWNVQETLLKAQATPLVGPIVVSPVKALISTAQLVAGIAGIILFGPLIVICNNKYCAKKAFCCVGHIGTGLIGLVDSIVNIVTLGILNKGVMGEAKDDVKAVRRNAS